MELWCKNRARCACVFVVSHVDVCGACWHAHTHTHTRTHTHKHNRLCVDTHARTHTHTQPTAGKYSREHTHMRPSSKYVYIWIQTMTHTHLRHRSVCLWVHHCKKMRKITHTCGTGASASEFIFHSRGIDGLLRQWFRSSLKRCSFIIETVFIHSKPWHGWPSSTVIWFITETLFVHHWNGVHSSLKPYSLIHSRGMDGLLRQS